MLTTDEAVFTNPKGFNKAIVAFLDLPSVIEAEELPRANVLEKGSAIVATMSCQTKSALSRLYTPWNAKLFAMEPWLTRFKEVPCAGVAASTAAHGGNPGG